MPNQPIDNALETAGAAPHLQCDECGRMSLGGEHDGKLCNFMQPNGINCHGRLLGGTGQLNDKEKPQEAPLSVLEAALKLIADWDEAGPWNSAGAFDAVMDIRSRVEALRAAVDNAPIPCDWQELETVSMADAEAELQATRILPTSSVTFLDRAPVILDESSEFTEGDYEKLKAMWARIENRKANRGKGKGEPLPVDTTSCDTEEQYLKLQDRYATEKRWREHYMERARIAEAFGLAAIHFVDYLRLFREGRDFLSLEANFIQAAADYHPQINEGIPEGTLAYGEAFCAMLSALQSLRGQDGHIYHGGGSECTGECKDAQEAVTLALEATGG